MRNPILAITIALTLAVPGTALADKKKSNTSGGAKYLQSNMNSVQVSGYARARQPSGSKVEPLASLKLGTIKEIGRAHV